MACDGQHGLKADLGRREIADGFKQGFRGVGHGLFSKARSQIVASLLQADRTRIVPSHGCAVVLAKPFLIIGMIDFEVAVWAKPAGVLFIDHRASCNAASDTLGWKQLFFVRVSHGLIGHWSLIDPTSKLSKSSGFDSPDNAHDRQ